MRAPAEEFVHPTFGMRCIQHILLAFNGLFSLTGIILMSVGSSVNSIYGEYATFLETRFFSPSLMIMLVGMSVFAIALFGCYGAWKLSVASIMIYSALMLVIYVLEVAAGVTGYILEDQIEDMLTGTMNQTLQQYTSDYVSAAAIDRLQNNLVCCGINGPEDWQMVAPSVNKTVLQLPESCCAVQNDNMCIAIKSIGCLPQLKFLMGQCSILFTGTVLLVALIQLMGAILSCKLARQLRRQKTLRDQLKWEVREGIKNCYPSMDYTNAIEKERQYSTDYIYYEKVSP